MEPLETGEPEDPELQYAVDVPQGCLLVLPALHYPTSGLICERPPAALCLDGEKTDGESVLVGQAEWSTTSWLDVWIACHRLVHSL